MLEKKKQNLKKKIWEKKNLEEKKNLCNDYFFFENIEKWYNNFCLLYIIRILIYYHVLSTFHAWSSCFPHMACSTGKITCY